MTDSRFHPLTAADVTFTVEIEPEHIPVRGNCLASGDDAADREYEDEILERLECGDESAWCVLVVTATASDGTEGRNTLGCCSLSREYTAKQCAKDQGMHDDALAALNAELAHACRACDDQQFALAAHLGCLPTEVDSDGDRYSVGRAEYLVLTDSEADDVADEQLDSYIDDCILPECPPVVAQYFDRALWKRDALLEHGRGHTLAGYDGAEGCETVDGTYYYIYRVG